jgi:hypothetical protein
MGNRSQAAVQQDEPITDINEAANDLDMDEVLLRQAQAEAKGEIEGDAGAGEAEEIVEVGDPPPAQATEPEQPPAQAPEATDPEPEPRKRMPEPVPYQRFQQVNDENRSLKDEVEYLRRANEALRHGTQQQPKAPDQPQPQPDATKEEAKQAESFEARLNEIAQSSIALAKDYDEGKLSLAELRAKEIEIERQKRAIDQEIVDARAKQLERQIEDLKKAVASPPPAVMDQKLMQAQAERLVQDYPWLGALDKDETLRLGKIARLEAEEMGRPYGTGPAETMRLRQHVAELSAFWGPRWHPDLADDGTPPRTQTQTSEQPPAQEPSLSPTAAARKAKLELAAALPPDTSNLGTQGAKTAMTVEKAADLSEDEYAALPKQLRSQYTQ